jgi:hypothetical protein
LHRQARRSFTAKHTPFCLHSFKVAMIPSIMTQRAWPQERLAETAETRWIFFHFETRVENGRSWRDEGGIIRACADQTRRATVETRDSKFKFQGNDAVVFERAERRRSVSRRDGSGCRFVIIGERLPGKGGSADEAYSRYCHWPRCPVKE